MISPEMAMLAGAILLGFVMGILFVGWIQRWRSSSAETLCSKCEKKGYVAKCDRCGKFFGNCHYWRVLIPDPSSPRLIEGRRSRAVCVDCVGTTESRFLDGTAQG